VTTYYVGSGGNNANAGTSWAQRKLTLNGAEDIPVAAGDTVYVAPGVYRETLTVDVSGGAGSVISYIGDYTGANTDGAGGIVRITGSDNDQTNARGNCVTANGKNYRTFRGFTCDSTTPFTLTDCQNWTIDQCHILTAATGNGVYVAGASQLNVTVSNCLIWGAGQNGAVIFTHTSTVDNVGHVISNSICHSSAGAGVQFVRVGGVTVRNSVFYGRYCVRQSTAPAAGQTNTINNCILADGQIGFQATATGELTENYNCIAIAVETARVNTNTGANSVIYLSAFDTRWFFEAVNGGRMLSPFDLASYSQLINVAGTSPTTTDLRGTSVIGGQREWGALEYDSTLILPAITEVIEAGGGTYHPAAVAEVLDSVAFGAASAQQGTYHAPAVGEVIDTAVFGPASGTAGTFAIPAEADVKDGVGYGEDGTEFEGELVAGGGGGVPVIGGNVVRR